MSTMFRFRAPRLAIALACLLVPWVVAQAGGDQFNPKFQYAAKFVCGFNPQTTERILPGLYATAVNIYNPSNRPAGHRGP